MADIEALGTAPATGDRAQRTAAAAAGSKNMLLLAHLRWIAAAGQLGTILTSRFLLGAALPMVPMAAIVAGLVLLNVGTLIVLRTGRPIGNRGLFVALLFDYAALTAQLYLSGGASNPFAPVGLLQIVLGAILLATWSSWTLVALHSAAFGVLTVVHRPLMLPVAYQSVISPIHVVAGWINFTLVAVLLVLFVTRVTGNLRLRDARLAEMRQREAEDDHIVRMGLLASGAAHELATPLSSVSVILGDWRRQPDLAANPGAREEIDEMQAAVARCKEIITGILYASGEARSELIERMTLRDFLASVVEQWSAQRPGLYRFVDRLRADPVIVADRTLAQVIGNVLDNAAEAGATRVEILAETFERRLVLTVEDDGPGFAAAILEGIGRPYRSTKARRGAGLGLFLAFNVMRKLGGAVDVRNGARGAVVALSVPLEALVLENDRA